ncbi:hypothetical protein FBU30_006064 [Linnemannia zychae]|nr:hypothetical protein FBU30_006064 [Linnemannia zychae]
MFSKHKRDPGRKPTSTAHSAAQHPSAPSTFSSSPFSTTPPTSSSSSRPNRPTTPPSPSTSSASAPSSHLPPNRHQAEPDTLLESVLESTSIKVAEAIQYTLTVINLSFLLQTYVDPIIRYFHLLYLEQPENSLGMACIGCLVVSGSVLVVMEILFMLFGGCILVPIGALTTVIIGLPALVLYGLISSISYLF